MMVDGGNVAPDHALTADWSGYTEVVDAGTAALAGRFMPAFALALLVARCFYV